MKKNLIIIFLIISGALQAQNAYQDVLNQIEANSVTLNAYKKKTQAYQAANEAGAFLDNPEVGANYLFGSPSEIGNRIDLSISQSFDFPTVYGSKRKIREMNNEVIDAQYQSDRITILTEAQHICNELVYYNMLIEIYNKCYDNAKSIAEGFKQKLELGDANILDYNKSQMNLANAKNDFEMATVQRENLLQMLKTLNGGIDIEFNENHFSSVILPEDFEQWYSQVEPRNPEVRQAEMQLSIDQQAVKLSKAERLPKFSLGYMLECEEDQNYQGITFGMTLPFWQNKKTVKFAKANAEATEAILGETKTMNHNNLYSLYLKAKALKSNIETLNENYVQFDSQELLKKAFDKGELSLLEYLMEIDYYQEARIKLLEAELELQEAVVELNAVML